MILIILTALNVLCAAGAVYAAWDAKFHTDNIERIYAGLPPLEHEHPFTAMVCGVITKWAN